MDTSKHPVIHFEIGCRDKDATKTFYQNTFGWKITPRGPAENIDTLSDSGIPGHISALGHEPHHYITFYIEVEDIEASISTVEENGGSLLAGPVELPDGQKFAWFKDVAGNTVGLLTKKEK